MKKLIKNFMSIYMYELEQYLNKYKKEEIKAVSFQSDEANTDRPLKEYLKKVMEKEIYSIPENSTIQEIYDNNTHEYVDVSIERKILVKRVLLPEEIIGDIKETIANRKDGAYVNPDLCLELFLDDKLIYETIELKSTKSNAIPGSSVQQILPDEWVIFVQHRGDTINVSVGQYVNSITTKMQFPDRSPRPQVAFDTIKKWNTSHRIVCDNSIEYKIDDEIQTRRALVADWQEVLAKRWVDIIFSKNNHGNREPWFNNNLRKFIILFLESYDNLTDTEKSGLKSNIMDLII